MNAAFMLSLVVTSALAWPQAPPAPLTAAPTRLTFIGRADRGTALPQRVKLAGSGGAALEWRAVASAPWIRVNPATGTTPGVVTISVDFAGLAEGDHRGHVTISTGAAPGPPSVVEVSVEIAAPQAAAPPGAGEPPPVTTPEPKAVSATAAPAPGAKTAEQPKATSEPLAVAAQMPAATRNLPYSQAIPITGGKPPFAVRLTQGRLPQGFRIEDGAVTGVTSRAGNYAFVITVTDSATPSATVVQMVSLRVILLYPDTAMTVYPAGITLSANAGAARPVTGNLAVSSGRQALDWRASTDVPWLTLKPAEGRGGMSIHLEANTAELAPGTYTATVTISMDGVPNSPARIPVQLTVRKQTR